MTDKVPPFSQGRNSGGRLLLALLTLVAVFLLPISTPAADNLSPLKEGKRLVKPLLEPQFAKPSPGTSFILPPVLQTPGDMTTADAPMFVLKQVRFIGNTRFSSEELLLIAEPFMDKPVSASDLEELRVRLSTRYIEAGYINSGAILPDQKITDGTVRYRIIEGGLTGITVSGTGWLRPEYVSSRLSSDPDGVLNVKTLQEAFQLLLTDPLFDRINGELRPGETIGEAQLDLDVTRSQPYSLALSVDNYHPPASGAYELNLDGSVQNLTSFGDELFIHAEKSEGAWDITGLFSIPVNRYDTRVFLWFDGGNSTVVEKPLDILDIESEYGSIEAGVTHPFYRSLTREFSAGISFSSSWSQTWMLGEPFPFSPGVEEDGYAKASVIKLIQEYVDRSSSQVIALRSTFGFGLPILDATVHEDEADSEFFVWIGQARYARKYEEINSRLLLRTDIQLASDVLLPMERFALGGRYSVRGYLENELVRDNGFAASAELRYNLHGDPDNRNDLSIQVAPFIDAGSGWNNSEFSEAPLLFSGGIGLVLNWKSLFAECYLAYPFTEPQEIVDYDLLDSGLYFRLSWNLF